MEAELLDILSKLELGDFSDGNEKDLLQNKSLPSDYLEFMQKHNG